MANEIRPLAARVFSDATGGDLDDWIASQRARDVSLRRIAKLLADLTDGVVDVTPQTILNWTRNNEPVA